MFFSYFPTKLSDKDLKKDLTIDGDSFLFQNMCYNW